MNRYIHIISWLLMALMITINSCVPPSNEIITDINNANSDLVYQGIYNHQDKQNIDSVLLYFNHSNPGYRLAAVNAMASIQSELSIDSLVEILGDPIIEVRTAAAYALGQIGNLETVDPLMNAFVNKDTSDVDNVFNSTILEAIGKTGNKSLLDVLASVESYRITDTLLLLGQSRAIYRYANRGINTQKGTNRMVELASNQAYPNEVRVIAANYLARAKDIDISKSQFRIAEALIGASDPNVRMAIALALRKVTEPDILKILQSQFIVEKDYRVKVNILKAFGSYKYIDNIDLILDHLDDENIHVANAAAQYLVDHGKRDDVEIYKTFAKKNLDHTVRAKIYASVLKHLPSYYIESRAIIRSSLLRYIKELKGKPYVAKHYVAALGQDPYSYAYLKEAAIDSGVVTIRTAGMEALSKIVSGKSFVNTFRFRSDRVKIEILDIIKEQFAKGDVGTMAIGAGILSNEKIGYRNLIQNDSFLIAAAAKLSLPREIETYNEIKKALAYINNVKYKAEKNSYNHPINWKTLATVSDSTIAVVRTNKGNFTIKLFGNTTPGSVANFIDLANDDFFDNKVYHRVVSNFVIQGGCPRGDGYGSLDYSIRSELPQLYYDDEGYVGMASAGLNTEGTQWFVTHSPTPHLDGKYTIFGKVTEGMDVVHQIVEGDKIIDVIISLQR
ncbi:peptidylprolyl isomerase [Saprospiraceae bacterium]|nr:peptidylprolyl isomerase [bacterium]MDB4162508.1 peptidylprolyl isomerase [Saprospiraceae bacterium]MDB4824347.1 peptidylprolyl isomerase [Saprospiraceae bacterium]